VSPTRGAVVRSVDPFKLGADAERYWLVISNETHPFGDEQVIAVTLTTVAHDPALAIPDDAWVEGGVPRESVVSPWGVHSFHVETITEQVGRLDESFVDEVVAAMRGYVE
jgi:mRNA-degrading endonuclease toxin of MazEF toxin-antitoxin module